MKVIPATLLRMEGRNQAEEAVVVVLGGKVWLSPGSKEMKALMGEEVSRGEDPGMLKLPGEPRIESPRQTSRLRVKRVGEGVDRSPFHTRRR